MERTPYQFYIFNHLEQKKKNMLINVRCIISSTLLIAQKKEFVNYPLRNFFALKFIYLNNSLDQNAFEKIYTQQHSGVHSTINRELMEVG